MWGLAGLVRVVLPHSDQKRLELRWQEFDVLFKGASASAETSVGWKTEELDERGAKGFDHLFGLGSEAGDSESHLSPFRHVQNRRVPALQMIPNDLTSGIEKWRPTFGRENEDFAKDVHLNESLIVPNAEVREAVMERFGIRYKRFVDNAKNRSSPAATRRGCAWWPILDSSSRFDRAPVRLRGRVRGAATLRH